MASSVANAVGLSSQTVLGRMLIAFGLFMVTGCALPDRTFSLSRGGRSVGRESLSDSISKSNARVDPPDDSHSTDDKNTRPALNIGGAATVSASAGRRNPTRAAAMKPGDASQLAPGYSLTGSADLNSVDRSPTSSPSADDPREIGKEVPAQVKFAGRTEDTRSNSKVAQDSAITPAKNEMASGKSSNPIQLQGLEFDEVPGSASKRDPSLQPTIRSWSDRIAEQSNESSKVTATSKTSVETVKPPTSTAPSVSVPPSRSTNQLPPLLWQSELEQLIVRVERDLSQTKPDSQSDRQNEFVRKQAHLRLLYLMAQRQEDALTAIPGIDPTQQEYWQQMIWALSNSFDTVQFPELAERAAQTVTPLSAALRLTREEAAISIKNMTFCRKISYFGNYERFPRNEFTPGYEVLLYTEIENFVSTPTVDGEYRTSLKSLIEIADSAGKIVWTKGFPPTEDFCRNPRRDYFHNYQFHIPEDLATGTYTLKLTIVDELSHKRASNSLNFVLK